MSRSHFPKPPCPPGFDASIDVRAPKPRPPASFCVTAGDRLHLRGCAEDLRDASSHTTNISLTRIRHVRLSVVSRRPVRQPSGWCCSTSAPTFFDISAVFLRRVEEVAQSRSTASSSVSPVRRWWLLVAGVLPPVAPMELGERTERPSDDVVMRISSYCAIELGPTTDKLAGRLSVQDDERQSARLGVPSFDVRDARALIRRSEAPGRLVLETRVAQGAAACGADEGRVRRKLDDVGVHVLRRFRQANFAP